MFPIMSKSAILVLVLRIVLEIRHIGIRPMILQNTTEKIINTLRNSKQKIVTIIYFLRNPLNPFFAYIYEAHGSVSTAMSLLLVIVCASQSWEKEVSLVKLNFKESNVNSFLNNSLLGFFFLTGL